MSRTTEKIEQYKALRPIDFRLMSRFEWVTAPLSEGYSQHLLIHLTSERQEPHTELVLNFDGVRNIRFAAIGLAQPLIEIRDVSSQQWDGVRYEVRDCENDIVYFLCRDFSASLLGTTA